MRLIKEETNERWTNLQRIAKELGLKPENPYLIALRRDAITLRRMYECECNGCTREKLPRETWQQYDAARLIQMEWVEKRIETLEKRIAKNCNTLGLHYYLQGDPRGCSVYVSKSEIPRDDYSRNATGVY